METNTTTHHFRIADFYLRITYCDNPKNGPHLLPSFEPFRIDEPVGEKPLVSIVVDDTLRPRPKATRQRIRDFDTGNGKTIVDKLDDGGYQFIIKNINESDCCLLISNKDFDECHCALNGNYLMRCFGLNNAMMLVFAFAASRHQTVLIHASLVRQHGYGYAFIAKSGTGKSTQVSMWLRHLPECDLMNDDNPVVRIVDGEPWIYGSPWSGKTPCYRNVKARLGGITRIDRQPYNQVERLDPINAFASVLPSCSSMKWDLDIYHYICDTVTRLIETSDIYILHCLPNREAAEVCHAGISKA